MTAIEKQLDSIVWCKDPWGAPEPSSEEARGLLRACRDARAPEPLYSVQDLIDNSNRFPVPFPVETVRLEQLKARTPVEILKRNATSTYPLIHERVLVLMADFLVYKRKHGSRIEKEMYKDMSIPQLIDRILQKRAITFMKARDQYKLITGETGTDGWESVGTDSEKPPLVLSRCLSYDEMKLSALVCVSGYTVCINDGTRRNAAVPKQDGVEKEAVIVGVIGPRFKRVNRMEYEDIVVDGGQNTPARGYGPAHAHAHDHDHRAHWRKLWDNFYQLPSITYSELHNSETPVPCTGARVFTNRWARVKDKAFDNTAYERRMQLVFDTVMLEAQARAEEVDKYAFLNIIGAGLGVWKLSPHQLDVFVLSCARRARALLQAGGLNRVAVVNLAYIKPGKHVLALFKTDKQNSSGDNEDAPQVLFLKHDSHPRGGIKFQLQSRQPSSELKGEHKGMLLVLTYPWDSNAHPGNEFWLGKLCTSGDPAAACSTQVAELHNARVHPGLRAPSTRVARCTSELQPLHQYAATAFQH